jgi:hypothetical protein
LVRAAGSKEEVGVLKGRGFKIKNVIKSIALSCQK